MTNALHTNTTPADHDATVVRLIQESATLGVAERSRWLRATASRRDISPDVIEHVLAYWSIAEPARRFEGRVLGEMECHDLLGYGGFGAVFRGDWTMMPGQFRTVAVKVVAAPPYGDERQLSARVAAEAERLLQIRSPYTPQLFRVNVVRNGGDGPLIAMAMSLVDDALPLTDFARSQRLGFRGVLDLFLEVCSGVETLHHQGLVHRDLKPGNVLVNRRNAAPVIVDFGLVSLLGDDVIRERFSRGAGTPEYRAPEQSQSSEHPIGTSTDVYALGLILEELLWIASEQSAGTEAPHHMLSCVPDGFQDLMRELIDRCLHKTPGERPLHAGSLRKSLENIPWLAFRVPECLITISRKRTLPEPIEVAVVSVESPPSKADVAPRPVQSDGGGELRLPCWATDPPTIDLSIDGLLASEQIRWAGTLGIDRRLVLLPGLELVVVPAGRTTVSDDRERLGANRASGSNASPFLIAAQPISVGLVEQFINTAHRHAASLRLAGELGRLVIDAQDRTSPVRGLSFDDAELITRWLSERTGSEFDIPTELEWELGVRSLWAADALAPAPEAMEPGPAPPGVHWRGGAPKLLEVTASSYSRLADGAFAHVGTGSVKVARGVRRSLTNAARPLAFCRESRNRRQRATDVVVRLVCRLHREQPHVG